MTDTTDIKALREIAFNANMAITRLSANSDDCLYAIGEDPQIDKDVELSNQFHKAFNPIVVIFLLDQLEAERKRADDLQRLVHVEASSFANERVRADKLAAENAAINDRLQKLILIVNNSDNSYCMCRDSMESHVGGGCGSPTGIFDYHYNAWLESEIETPNTDAFTAELRAQGVDEFAADMWKQGNELVAEGAKKSLVVQVRLAAKLADTYVDNLRAGRRV